MDDHGPLLSGALIFDQVDELKGVTDGAVRIGPAWGTVVFHL